MRSVWCGWLYKVISLESWVPQFVNNEAYQQWSLTFKFCSLIYSQSCLQRSLQLCLTNNTQAFLFPAKWAQFKWNQIQYYHSFCIGLKLISPWKHKIHSFSCDKSFQMVYLILLFFLFNNKWLPEGTLLFNGLNHWDSNKKSFLSIPVDFLTHHLH